MPATPPSSAPPPSASTPPHRVDAGADAALGGDHAAQLRRAKWQATGLLAGTAVVFGATHFFPPGLTISCLRTVTEAAMVGGLADWFAVSAMFRRIPLPFVQRHTDIIARNKDRIGGNLSEFVRERFLDAPSLVSLIRRHNPADLLAQWLTSPASAGLLGRQVARLALTALDTVEDRKIESFLGEALRALLGHIDLTRSMAVVLVTLTENGRHQAVLDDVLGRLAHMLQSAHTRTFIADTLVQWIKREHPLKQKVLPTDWISGKGADAIAHAIEVLLKEVAHDPDHQLREVLDASLQRMIERLQTDADWVRRGEEVRAYLQNDAALGGYVQELWASARTRLQRDLADEQSVMAEKVAAMGQWLGQSLAHDAALRVRLNVQLELWAATWAPDVAQSVAQHIRDTVQGWDAQEMSDLVELHIGRDLQYIRINGTVVGGGIGLVLFAISHLGDLAALVRSSGH